VKDRALRLARLGRALRAEGVGVVLRDELDAAEALAVVDTSDREEVHRSLRVALKVPPPGRAAFDRLFAAFWTGEERTAAAPPPPRTATPPRSTPGSPLRWDPDTRTLHGTRAGEVAGGDEPGASAVALRRRTRLDPAAPADQAAMERVLARLARRLATRRSRRLVPTRGRGHTDVRHSFRRALRTEGELVSLARRTRALREPRLVFLCDTSGSMDPHARFLLSFLLALRRALRHVEVFAFNTELAHLTPLLSPARAQARLDRLARAVPDWSGGTRIGDCLSAFLERHAESMVVGRTLVVVLSDGLEGGDTARLAAAARALRRRARKLIWLNPLLSDTRYRPDARGMRAVMPFVDQLAAAHDLESLERLIGVLAA
jgi:uncharacterized protein with von Willebrand factor type A (vWA) domain